MLGLRPLRMPRAKFQPRLARITLRPLSHNPNLSLKTSPARTPNISPSRPRRSYSLGAFFLHASRTREP